MAEVEIHTGHGHPEDSFGRRVGVAVGIIGIILAVVTIASLRAHTAAVIVRTERTTNGPSTRPRSCASIS